jgi:rubrerythrin
MSKYIDADATELAVVKATTYGDALRAVREQPSIDIEPKRGEWVLSSDGYGYIGNPVYKCTVCGWWDEETPYNFCPNCGADMSG